MEVLQKQSRWPYRTHNLGFYPQYIQVQSSFGLLSRGLFLSFIVRKVSEYFVGDFDGHIIWYYVLSDVKFSSLNKSRYKDWVFRYFDL